MSPHRRVGLLIPSSNTMMEPDFARGLPPTATLHTGRMYMAETTALAEERMLDEFAEPAARDVGTAKPDVVVFGCTSAGALRGNDYDAELCERISELTCAPTISTIQSVREAILSSGASVIGVVTPYIDELNERIKASVEADGVQVARIAGMGITDNFAIAEVTSEQL
ncbi:MAG: maleate cis-trans isomerase family protein, partial [Acidimicrobiales bacterium]